MPVNKPLLFNPTELGHITQFPTFDIRRAGMYTPKEIKNFWYNIIHASTSDNVFKKLTRTTLTPGDTVRISDPENIKHLFGLDDRLLMVHLLTPSIFVDKFYEIFGLLGYYFQSLGNFFACFVLLKFNPDVVFIVLRGLEIRKVSGATLGLVRAILGANFHFFVLSPWTTMSENDENKGYLRMQNVKGKENVAAPFYEENPTSLYPHVHIVNNSIPISSNITESKGKDLNVFHSSRNAPLNPIVSFHGNAPSIEVLFSILVFTEMLPVLQVHS